MLAHESAPRLETNGKLPYAFTQSAYGRSAMCSLGSINASSRVSLQAGLAPERQKQINKKHEANFKKTGKVGVGAFPARPISTESQRKIMQ